MSRARQSLADRLGPLSRADKRRAFLLGMMLVAEMENDPECRKAVLDQLDFFLTHPRDRRLFDLPPLPRQPDIQPNPAIHPGPVPPDAA